MRESDRPADGETEHDRAERPSQEDEHRDQHGACLAAQREQTPPTRAEFRRLCRASLREGENPAFALLFATPARRASETSRSAGRLERDLHGSGGLVQVLVDPSEKSRSSDRPITFTPVGTQRSIRTLVLVTWGVIVMTVAVVQPFSRISSRNQRASPRVVNGSG